jgi:Fic-DOC domain mobile mystery protein B
MTSNWGADTPGSTPLEADDFEQLIPTDITTRAELNAAERDNIVDARIWAFTQQPITDVQQLFETTTVDEIHRRMFSDVWKWAGKRRTRATTIGVAPAQIVTHLKDALDDAKYWKDNGTFDPVGTAVRFHHRLVFVHPYVNGNGRHARLVADLYLRLVNGSTLQWGPDESELSDSRAAYIAALRKADDGDYSQLIAYASGE